MIHLPTRIPARCAPLGRLLAALLTALLLAAQTASAAVYYVDALEGDDRASGKSPQAAWKTIARVNATPLAPGDTVYLQRGRTWRETLLPRGSGRQDAPIVFSAYGDGARPRLLGSVDRSGAANWTAEGERLWYTTGLRWERNYFGLRQGAIFHDGFGGAQRQRADALRDPWDWWHDAGRGRTYVLLDHNPGLHAIEVVQRNGVGFSGSDHITLRGLEIAYADIGVAIWQGVGWTLEELYIHDTANDAIHANGQDRHPDRGTVSDSLIQDWGWKGYGYGAHDYANWTANEPYMGYGIHVFHGEDWTVSGNTLRLVNMRCGTDCSPIAFDHNGHAKRIEGNYVDGADRLGAPSTGVMLWHTRGSSPIVVRDNTFLNLAGMAIILQDFDKGGFRQPVTVEDNVIRDVCLADGPDAEALRIWTRTNSLVTVRRNVIVGTRDGRHAHHGIRVRNSRADLYHNTVTGADLGFSIESSSTVTARNNIASANRLGAAGVSGGSVFTGSHNDWHGGVTGFQPHATDLDADPRFVNLTSGGLGLRADSPGIDAGTDLGLPFTGQAPDLGAFERSESDAGDESAPVTLPAPQLRP